MRDIAFSCDDNGADFLKVAVGSLLKHYCGSEPLRVNVFEGWGGHSEAHKRELESLVARYPVASLRYVNVEGAVAPYADLLLHREGSRWNIFTWTPIFTPEVLPDATGNVIHLDIDMLVNADISELFELDLGDNLIAAVAEYGCGDADIHEAVWGAGILPPTVQRYFNTGTIVFNVEKCRAERTWEKIVDWYRDHYAIAGRIEQDAWNALYHDRTLLLPLRWNFHDRNIKRFARWNMKSDLWLGNPPCECLVAAAAPAILHFWGPKKPWKVSHRPYRALYHQAMRDVGLTPPPEPAFAWWHNLQNAADMRKIRRRIDRVLEGKSDLKKRIRRLLMVPIEWFAIALGLVTMPLLPRRALFALCDVLSRTMYRFDRRGRNRALENLRILRGNCRGGEGTPAFDPDYAKYDPDQLEEKIIRRSYRNMARTVGYAFWTCWRARERASATGELAPRVRAFLDANRPAITVSGHIGCWEILSQLAFLAGHRMISVAKNIGTSGMTRLLMRSRRSIGQEIVPADGAFKPLMAAVREGKSVGLLVDQCVSAKHGGIWVRFLGRPVPVSAAPAFFAAKAKVPILISWSRPLPRGRYRAEFVETIDAAVARDIWRTTQRCASALERVVRRHPSCWVLNYNLFSNIPTAADLEQLSKREAETSGDLS